MDGEAESAPRQSSKTSRTAAPADEICSSAAASSGSSDGGDSTASSRTLAHPSTSPRLDAWAATHAQVFDDALADSNWTLPSTATLLTGLATRQHGLLAFPAALGPTTPTLAERLSAEGYDTLAFTDGGFVGPTFGFDRGFDRFVVDADQVPDWRPALDHLARRGDDRPVISQAALHRSGSRARRNRFCPSHISPSPPGWLVRLKWAPCCPSVLVTVLTVLTVLTARGGTAGTEGPIGILFTKRKNRGSGLHFASDST